MGLRDNLTRLVDSQAFTVTAVATNTFVLGHTGEDISAGEPMAVRFTLEAVSAVSGTLQFQVVTATASDGTTGSVVIVETVAITDTVLSVGKTIDLIIPPGQIPLRASTATHLTGKIVIASSGTCTATIDLLPASMLDNQRTYHAEPVMQ